jgi:hypothetical protein
MKMWLRKSCAAWLVFSFFLLADGKAGAQDTTLNDPLIWRACFPQKNHFDKDGRLMRNVLEDGKTVSYRTVIDKKLYYDLQGKPKAIVVLLSYDYTSGKKLDCHACFPEMSVARFGRADTGWMLEKFVRRFAGSTGAWGEGPDTTSLRTVRGKSYLRISWAYGNQGQFERYIDYFNLVDFEKAEVSDRSPVTSAGWQRPGYVYEGFGDSPEDVLSPTSLKPWVAQNKTSYTGLYHFGESEGEWDVLVIVTDSGIALETFRNKWAKPDNQSDTTWVKSCEAFRNVRITGSRFTSDSLTGYFTVHTTKKGGEYGMILPTASGSMDTCTYGGREAYNLPMTKFWFFKEGDHPEVSYRLLTKEELYGDSGEQLEMMGDEVYARYGLRFTPGSRQYRYFAKKTWYLPYRDDVTSCLTEIERWNLAKIKVFSALKK